MPAHRTPHHPTHPTHPLPDINDPLSSNPDPTHVDAGHLHLVQDRSMSDNDLGSQGDGDALDNGEGEEIEALKGGGEESEGADDKPDKGKGVEGNEAESEEEGFVKGRAMIQWLEPDPELAPVPFADKIEWDIFGPYRLREWPPNQGRTIRPLPSSIRPDRIDDSSKLEYNFESKVSNLRRAINIAARPTSMVRTGESACFNCRQMIGKKKTCLVGCVVTSEDPAAACSECTGSGKSHTCDFRQTQRTNDTQTTLGVKLHKADVLMDLMTTFMESTHEKLTDDIKLVIAGIITAETVKVVRSGMLSIADTGVALEEGEYVPDVVSKIKIPFTQPADQASL